MSLTKEDLGKIEEVVIKVVEPRFRKVNQDIEDLAAASQKQFAAIDERFDQMDVRFDQLEDDMAGVKDTVIDHHFRIGKLERKSKAA